MTLATCIMPTANRRQFVPGSIKMFLAQDYDRKELIVLDDGTDSIGDLVPNHSQIRYIRVNARTPLGAKRNIACEAAKGSVILHWDDDDWYAAWRVRFQVTMLDLAGTEICGISNVIFIDTAASRVWEYVYPVRRPQWVCGATLCYRKSFWQRHKFLPINVGEDTRFVFTSRGALTVLKDNHFFVGRIHVGNTSRKRIMNSWWQPRPLELAYSILGDQSEEFLQCALTNVSQSGPSPSNRQIQRAHR